MENVKEIYKKIFKYIYIIINVFLIFLGSLLIFIKKKITRTKGNPRKYNKDKSIGIFIPHFNKDGERDCEEIARGQITSKGDIYIFTNLKSQKEYPFHESFHKSGRHHWKEGKEYLYPLAFNGDGLPASEKMKNFRINLQPCFCFRRGKRLKDEEIKLLIEKLLRFVPPVNFEELFSSLKSKGIFKAKLPNYFKHLLKRIEILNQ